MEGGRGTSSARGQALVGSVSANQQRRSITSRSGAKFALLFLDPSQAHHPSGMDGSPQLGGKAAQGAQKQVHGATTSAKAQ
eukprot:9978108-Karenia_brevis.AAC.1